MPKRLLAILISLCMLYSPAGILAQGMKIAGISFDSSISKDDTLLKLNGVGLRTATIFGIKVYAMGIYLENTSNDPVKVIYDQGAKLVVMKFLRSVSGDKLADAWISGVKKNFSNASQVEFQILTYSKAMPDVEEGDELEIYFKGDLFLTYLNGKLISEMEGKIVQQAILSCWFGDHPPNKSLKKGLLSIS